MSDDKNATGGRRRVSPPRTSPTLARFVLDQLWEAGIDTIFGLPGDFILRLCQVIEEDARIRLLTASHEPGVGFAAVGAARGPQGLGVACVTYGAGALNMVNPTAAAWAEKSPLLVLSGGPGPEERSRGVLVHHQVKGFESQLKVFREVTQYQAVLDDPETAADQVRYAIDVCRLYSLPVYLEIPREMVDRPIRVSKVRSLTVPTDRGAVEEAAGEIGSRLREARRPVLIAGVEIHRQRLTARLVDLAEALGVPVVTTFLGRGGVPTDHPLYAGTYLGPASSPGIQELVEQADLVVMLGALLSDTNMGVRLLSLDPRGLALAVSRSVKIGYHRYDGVPLEELLGELLRGTAGATPGGERHPRAERAAYRVAADAPAEGPIRVAELIAEINRLFRTGRVLPVVADTGDCLFCTYELDARELLGSAYYATMGFGVPAAMGFQATGGDRPLVLVGDGGFQMTGLELLHAARWGVSPIVVVMNNGSWEMLQSFLAAGYNRLEDARYRELAGLWGVASWLAPTAAALRESLEAALGQPGPALIEVPLEPGDISATLAAFTRSVTGAGG